MVGRGLRSSREVTHILLTDNRVIVADNIVLTGHWEVLILNVYTLVSFIVLSFG